jgi:hypothetical protein
VVPIEWLKGVASLSRSIAICACIIAAIEQLRRDLNGDDDPPVGVV